MSFGGPISHAKVPVNISRLETLLNKVVHSIEQVPSIKGSYSSEHIKFQAIQDSMCIKFQDLLSLHFRTTIEILLWPSSGSRRGGGLGGLNPPSEFFFLACQYMKIPTDLDPKPPFEEFWRRTPL